MDYPMVSVIIPAYKYHGDVIAAYRSVAEQSYPNIRIHAVPISWDGLNQRLDSLEKDIDRYRNGVHTSIHPMEENKGPNGAANHIWEEVSGKFITFMDPDDRYTTPISLENLVQPFLGNSGEDVGITASDCIVVDMKGNHRVYGTTGGYDREKFLNGINSLPTTAVVRKRLYDMVQPFPDEFPPDEEGPYKGSTKLQRNLPLIEQVDVNVVWIGYPLWEYGWGDHNLTKKIKKNGQNIMNGGFRVVKLDEEAWSL
jgi:glycosyltransferase involved in cell wall biosynthesis